MDVKHKAPVFKTSWTK